MFSLYQAPEAGVEQTGQHVFIVQIKTCWGKL